MLWSYDYSICSSHPLARTVKALRNSFIRPSIFIIAIAQRPLGPLACSAQSECRAEGALHYRARNLGATAVTSRCIPTPFRVDFSRKSVGIAVRSIARKIGWLCVLLTLWLAVASVAHHHSNPDRASTCAVCVAAHSTTKSTHFTLPATTSFLVATVVLPTPSARQRLLAFALTVRPPPEI